MVYKILHFSDLHLDASFAGQGFPLDYGNERRLGLRATLTQIFSKAREYKVDAVTIAGDLFVQEYLFPETADFIRKQFASLDPIRVIISPGFQDPYSNESIYSNFKWPRNVDIFNQSKLASLQLTPEIYIWGASNPPTRGRNLLDGFQLKNGVNILLLHALKKPDSSDIHVISNEVVQKAGFHLALLGGEHAAEILPLEKSKLIFPGSPEPLSPLEEMNSHKLALIEVDEKNIRVQPLSVRQWHYHIIEVDVTTCKSNSEVAQSIEAAIETDIAKSHTSAITVKLIGKPTFALNLFELRALIQSSSFFCLEDYFTINYDLEILAREQTVRGLLVQRFLSRIGSEVSETEKQRQLTALNMILQSLGESQVGLYEIKKN